MIIAGSAINCRHQPDGQWIFCAFTQIWGMEGGRRGQMPNRKDVHTMTTNRIPHHCELFVQISYLTIFVESSPVFADSKPLFMICKSCEAYFLSPELVINAIWKCFMINQVGPRYVSDPSKNYLEEFLWAIQCPMHIVHMFIVRVDTKIAAWFKNMIHLQYE